VRILVVDDDALQREVLSAALATKGWAVRTAANGAEGLAALRDEVPDLLVLDLMMPGLDGPSVLEAMRADPRFDRVRVLVTTAVASPHVPRLLKPHATLFKPFGLAEFLRAIGALARQVPA
jgi:CheY-like chemotaxis protein